MIPADWKTKTLEAICDQKAPIRYGVVQIGADTPGGVPIVPIKFIDRIQSAQLHRARLDIEKKYAGSRIQGGDVLLSVKGSIGHVGLVPEGFCGNIAREIARIRPNGEVDAWYLAHALQSQETQKRIGQKTVGTTRLEFSIWAVRKFSIAVPPLPEQRRIAEILSTWDRAIETTEKLIANSEAQKKALMQQLLTGKKRLPGFSGKWQETPIARMGNIVAGGTPDSTDPNCWNGDIAWATPTDITKLRTRYISRTERYITPLGLSSSAAKRLPAGTVIVCTRATVGALAIATIPMTTNQGFKNIVPNGTHDSDFIYYLLCKNKKALVRAAGGSTFAEVSKADFEKLTFSVPQIDEQRSIAAVLMRADETLENLQSKLTALRQEKSALMQQLLTGKRRVKLPEKIHA